MSDSVRDLAQYREQRLVQGHELMRRRLARRATFRGASLLALGSSSAMAAFIAACSGGGGSNKSSASSSGGSKGQGYVPQTPAPTGAPAATFKDTTGTPPYKQGVAGAQVDAKWQQFPFVYKYNWRRYNWDVPLTTGGHAISTAVLPPNYDLMKTQNGVPGSLYYQGLWRLAIHSNINLDGSSIEPDLAAKSEHSPDYSSWTFTLNPGVKFHDIAPVNGREMTADDVAFSFQRYIDTSIWAKGLQYVDKVTAPDKYTVRFDMKQPQVTFDATTATPYYVVFAKEHFNNADLFKTQPIGTGAFFNKESIYQDHATALRNPNFIQKPTWMADKYKNTPMPFMDGMTIQYFPSDAASRAAFIAGSTDDYAITYLDPAILKEVLSARPDTIVTVNALWATYPVMGLWNYKNPLFQDIRVRRALSMGLDREAVMQNVFSGAGVPGGGPFAFDLTGQDLPPPLSEYGPYYQFNVQQAQALLKEAGHENGLSFQWEMSSLLQGTPTFQAYKAVQAQWKQNLKVDAQFNLVDALTATNDGLNHAFPDMIAQTTAGGYDAYSLAYPILHSKGGINLGQLNDPQLDTLFDQLGAATSPAAVLSSAKQIDARIRDQVSYLYVGWPQACTVTQPWLHGSTNNLYAYLFYYGINNFRSVWLDANTPGGRGGKPV
ncbi:MAG: ABC transporter substrate-binding protein [Dehalococcoidia bacterium]